MITDNLINWHSLNNILLRGITSNHNGDFYCLNYFHSYRAKKKVNKHERIRKDLDFCYSVYSKLNKEDITKEEYGFSLKVCKEFR